MTPHTNIVFDQPVSADTFGQWFSVEFNRASPYVGIHVYVATGVTCDIAIEGRNTSAQAGQAWLINWTALTNTSKCNNAPAAVQLRVHVLNVTGSGRVQVTTREMCQPIP